MKMVTLGKTGITVPQNAFGALPIQRVDMETARQILHRAYEGGMRFFDTARAYSDSEEKLGNAFEGMREKIFIASKTMGRTPEDFKEQLDTSLKLLKTDYLDLYQFHCVDQCYRPGDGTGMYECMLEAKEQGKIRHIGVTAHNMGFIAMKGLAGGLINNSRAAYAYISQFDNVLPIWGIQKMSELEEWLSYMDNAPVMDEKIKDFIEKEKKELDGDFCRGCGYCMPCPAGILINNCARMSLMVRRAPSDRWLNETWQENMKKIEGCLHCNKCMKKCPYQLNTPELLQKNYEDYKKILTGEIKVC